MPPRSICFQILLFIFYACVFFTASASLFSPPLLLKDVGLQEVGLFFLVSSGTMIIGRLSFARLTDVYGRGPMFFYSFLIIIASVVMVARVDSLTMLMAAALLYGIGSTISMPALTALIADNSDAQARGRVYSFFYGAFDIGVLSAGVSLGFLADLFGLSGMFMISAGMGFAAAFFFMLTIRSPLGLSVRWTLIGK